MIFEIWVEGWGKVLEDLSPSVSVLFNMIILGLDPSLTQFGWALIDTEASPAKRLIESGRFKTTSKQLFIERYISHRESLRNLIQERNPDKVGIEYPVFKDLYSEGMYALYVCCMEAIYSENKDVVLYSPTQIKAYAKEFLQRPAGWKMSKSEMVKAAKKHAKIKGTLNNNEADAYWIAQIAGRFWLFENGTLEKEDLTPVESKQFSYEHTKTRSSFL